jgi:hypothetical protein
LTIRRFCARRIADDCRQRRTRCQVSGVRCQVSGVRCEVRGAGCQAINLGSEVHSERQIDVPSRNVYENKGARKAEVSRLVRTGGSRRAGSCSQKMKVQPEMLLKINDREHRTRGVPILASDSCLLASLLQGTQAPVERGAHTPVTGYPGNMLKTKVRRTQSPITNRHSPMPWLPTPHFKK